MSWCFHSPQSDSHAACTNTGTHHINPGSTSFDARARERLSFNFPEGGCHDPHCRYMKVPDAGPGTSAMRLVNCSPTKSGNPRGPGLPLPLRRCCQNRTNCLSFVVLPLPLHAPLSPINRANDNSNASLRCRPRDARASCSSFQQSCRPWDLHLLMPRRLRDMHTTRLGALTSNRCSATTLPCLG